MSPPTDGADPNDHTVGAADWWRDAVVYQVYPRSFADADGDGIGDLAGITGRLDSLSHLGVDAVWFSPFYASPQADGGYDVADYRSVDPIFGSLADFDALLERAHTLGLRVIVDLVPNHSSDAHPWFRAALTGRPGSRERARYLFREGRGDGGNEPPNNWQSVFGGPAWTRVPDPGGAPGQWYLHLFDARQPDFDWTNPEVRAEFDAILRFWLDRGVDGFRIDVANSLIKADGLPDFEIDVDGGAMAFVTPDANASEPGDEPAAPMWDQDGVHEIYRNWRKIIDAYAPPRVLVAEAWVQPIFRLARYVRPDEMHQAFNFEYLSTPWDAAVLRSVINGSLTVNRAVGATTTWVLSNHDVVRHTSRFGLAVQGKRPNGIGVGDPQPDPLLGLRRARAATLTMLALPGSAYLYQGEELGLPEHTTLDDRLRQDPTWQRSGHTARGRDGCRIPLPWEAHAPGLGFGPSGRTWLPQPDSFPALARDAQVGVAGSTLEMYRSALALRRMHLLGTGGLDWLDSEPDVIAFRNGHVTIIANMGRGEIDLPRGNVILASGGLPADGTLPADCAIWMS